MEGHWEEKTIPASETHSFSLSFNRYVLRAYYVLSSVSKANESKSSWSEFQQLSVYYPSSFSIFWLLTIISILQPQERRKSSEGTTEDEMVGWHHQLDEHEFE